MKKIIKSFFVAILFVMFTGILSCEKPKPLCERNNFCTVIVKNNSSIAIWVDVTDPGSYYNQEVRLTPGKSYTYTMTPGTLGFWAADDVDRQLDLWNYDEDHVYQCEEYTYTWTNKKGVEGTSLSGGVNAKTILNER